MISTQLTEMLFKAGFHLRKWATNAPEDIEHLFSAELAESPVTLSGCNLVMHPTLYNGLLYEKNYISNMIYREDRTRDAAYCHLCVPSLPHLVSWHRFAYHLSSCYKGCVKPALDGTLVSTSHVQKNGQIGLTLSTGSVKSDNL
ncbi:hypothetical protein X801_07889, partial [Opisthorchis viverrini]